MSNNALYRHGKKVKNLKKIITCIKIENNLRHFSVFSVKFPGNASTQPVKGSGMMFRELSMDE